MIKDIQAVPTKINPEYELTGEYRVPQKHLNDMWAQCRSEHDKVYTFECGHSPTGLVNGGKRWILRKKELPPKPSQAWLDKHSVELTGECRKPKDGELVVSWNSWSSHTAYPFKWEKKNSKFIDKTGPGSMRWILQKKSTPAPAPAPTNEKQYLVCKISSKGLIEYFRQPGNGLTVERSLASPYTEERALKTINLFPNLLFMTKA